jgi:PAS domain S-box-containing protein
MASRKGTSDFHSDELRRRAEERAGPRVDSAETTEDIRLKRLVHELEVHKIELELQNEQLKQAKEELRARYDDLYDFAPVGYFTLGPRGEIEKSNLTGASMLGPPRGLLQGRRFATFVVPDSISPFNEFLRRIMTGRNKESCIVTLTNVGDTTLIAYIEATGVGRNASVPITVVDITSAEQARLAQRLGEERLGLALSASTMGLLEWERDTGELYWSPECAAIFGLDQITPTVDALARLVHHDHANDVRRAISQMLADGKERALKCRIVRPDGTAAWILARGRGRRDEEGTPSRLIGVVQEIDGDKPKA